MKIRTSSSDIRDIKTYLERVLVLKNGFTKLFYRGPIILSTKS